MPSAFPVAAPVIGLIAFAAAAGATPLVRALARRFGAVAMPRNDRWHRRPTAMMGGIAIFVAVMATLPWLVRLTTEGWVVLGTTPLLFGAELLAYFLKTKPYQKLIGQLIGVALILYFGLVLPWTDSA